MKHNKGFTLIELIVVIIIIGILASVAVPAYQSYVKSSKTKSAQSLEKEINMILDAHYSFYGTLPAAPDPATTVAVPASPPTSAASSSSFYEVLEHFKKQMPINPFCGSSAQSNAGKTWSDIYSADNSATYSLNTMGIIYTSPDQSTGSFTLQIDEASASSTNC